ncbi:MAG: High-affinity branched-chain amino acid transport ATP-binding protein LivF [candidate division WS2 bacterium]|nr:High-affinity branched-chain amino acid transport ATP-binding protein LivF [Candidatus Lithacetigena glycinireducens]
MIEELFEVIKKINEMGTTILLVEQNARLALGYAYYEYLLEGGNIVTEGTCKSLIEDPRVKEAYLGG